MKIVILLLAFCLSIGSSVAETTGPPLNQNAANAATVIDKVFQLKYLGTDGVIDYPAVYNTLGALAGFACQMTIREGFVAKGIISEDKAFVVLKLKDGRRYFYGDNLNAFLFGDNGFKYSVWSLVAGAAQRNGAKQFPDLREIAEYNAQVLGSEKFGVPRIPGQYRSKELPVEAVAKYWPDLLNIFKQEKVDPVIWSATIAFAIQTMMLQNSSKLDPEITLKIVMEAAVPMSKIDPETVKK